MALGLARSTESLVSHIIEQFNTLTFVGFDFPNTNWIFIHEMEPGDNTYLKYLQNIPYRILVFVIHDLGRQGAAWGCFHCKQIKLTKNTTGKNLGGSNIVLSNLM